MFRTSCVHHQEDYIVHAVLYGLFVMLDCINKYHLQYSNHFYETFYCIF